ncbi:MAG: hypothetical protein ACKO9Q_22660, partial [Pirellula sp.]
LRNHLRALKHCPNRISNVMLSARDRGVLGAPSIGVQAQRRGGLISIPRRWLRVKRRFAKANSVDDFSEIIYER